MKNIKVKMYKDREWQDLDFDADKPQEWEGARFAEFQTASGTCIVRAMEGPYGPALEIMWRP